MLNSPIEMHRCGGTFGTAENQELCRCHERLSENRKTLEYIILIRIKKNVEVLCMYFVFTTQKEACAF